MKESMRWYERTAARSLLAAVGNLELLADVRETGSIFQLAMALHATGGSDNGDRYFAKCEIAIYEMDCETNMRNYE